MKKLEEPNQPTPYVKYSNGVEISVWPELDTYNTHIENSVFTYSYIVKIRNTSAQTVQLVSRHWIIKDGFSNEEHVEGEGVVGKQPFIHPGESFLYQSFCPLNTPTGSMLGTYQMKDGSGKSFEVSIPEFHLKHKTLIN